MVVDLWSVTLLGYFLKLLIGTSIAIGFRLWQSVAIYLNDFNWNPFIVGG